MTRKGASVSTGSGRRRRRWRVARVALARRAQQLGGRLDRPALDAGRGTARLMTRAAAIDVETLGDVNNEDAGASDGGTAALDGTGV